MRRQRSQSVDVVPSRPSSFVSKSKRQRSQSLHDPSRSVDVDAELEAASVLRSMVDAKHRLPGVKQWLVMRGGNVTVEIIGENHGDAQRDATQAQAGVIALGDVLTYGQDDMTDVIVEANSEMRHCGNRDIQVFQSIDREMHLYISAMLKKIRYTFADIRSELPVNIGFDTELFDSITHKGATTDTRLKVFKYVIDRSRMFVGCGNGMPSPFGDLHNILFDEHIMDRKNLRVLMNMMEDTAFEDERQALRDVIDAVDKAAISSTTVDTHLLSLLAQWQIIQGKYMEFYMVYMVLLKMVASGDNCRGLVIVGNGHVERIRDILHGACGFHCVEMLERNRDDSWAVQEN